MHLLFGEAGLACKYLSKCLTMCFEQIKSLNCELVNSWHSFEVAILYIGPFDIRDNCLLAKISSNVSNRRANIGGITF